MRINDVISLLVATYSEWKDVLANPNFVRKGRTITWHNYSPGDLGVPVSHFDIVRLYEKGQYSFQLVDGSLLQIYYAYRRSTDILVEASLAFYKAQTWYDQLEDEAREIGVSITPLDASLGTINDAVSAYLTWLRIDYCPRTAAGVLHNACHLHLSTFPNARVAVAGVPTPKQFVEFVIALCYPDVYRAHRLDATGSYKDPGKMASINVPCVPSSEDLVFRQIMHLRIPGAASERGINDRGEARAQTGSSPPRKSRRNGNPRNPS